MSYVLAYITVKDKKEAKKIGQHLICSKIAACINILTGMQSMYLWQGKVEKNNEAILLVKTTSKNKTRLLSEVKKYHSYDCPCILFFKIESGNPHYLNWLAESVA